MSKEALENLGNEWSHFIDADDVEAGPGLKLTISPDKTARERLLKRLGILGIEDLKADLSLKREQGNMVLHITGHIKAQLLQKCVVTLETLQTAVDEDFEAWFADPAQAVRLAKAKQEKLAKTGGGEVPVLDESEDPEAIVDGKIDLGELVTQHLSLSIEPYPHAEGVHYEYGDDEPQKVPEGFKTNPFEALKNWKAKLEE